MPTLRQNDFVSTIDDMRRVRVIDKILLSKWAQLGLLLLLTAVITPCLLFFFVYSSNALGSSEVSHTCNIKSTNQIQCGPPNITQSHCEDILHCCFRKTCFHFLPSKHIYQKSNDVFQAQQTETPLGSSSIKNLGIQIQEKSKYEIDFVIYNSDEITLQNTNLNEEKLYKYSVSDSLGIEVTRDNSSIFSTVTGPMIASKGYWEISVNLSTTIFGLGELYLKPKSFIFYNNPGDLSRLPIVLGVSDGKFHGVLIEHRGLLEIEILESKLMILRCLTSNSIGFTFRVVVGDHPKDVLRYFRKIINGGSGWNPPTWLFGVHVCRNNSEVYNIDQTLLNANKWKKKAKKAKFPYESDCIHSNLFSLSMNTTKDQNEEINKFIKTMVETKRFLLPLKPEILEKSKAFDLGLKTDALYKDTTECTILSGNSTTGLVGYLNYAKVEFLTEILDEIPGIDATSGLILKNTWPLYDSLVDTTEDQELLYQTQDISSAINSTLPWNSSSSCEGEPHIENHQNYGHEFITQVIEYFSSKLEPNKIDLLMSSTWSNYPRIGVINQVLNSTWLNLDKMLTNALFHSIFVNPLASTSPVCGTPMFRLTSEVEDTLCLRWYLVAATIPMFYMNSDDDFQRDALSLLTKTSQKYVLDVVRKRYALLPYFSTVIFDKEDEEVLEPIIRPMWYMFPEDNLTFTLNSQYMIGEALMVKQILIPKHNEVEIYFPGACESSVWYEFWGGQQYVVPENGRMIKIFPTNSDWIMYFLGGNIIGIHDFLEIGNGNANDFRQTKPLTVVIGLKCISGTTQDERKTDEVCLATGKHLVSQTDIFLDFHSNRDRLLIFNVDKVVKFYCNNGNQLKINRILVYGLDSKEFKEMKVEVDICSIKEDSYEHFFEK